MVRGKSGSGEEEAVFRLDMKITKTGPGSRVNRMKTASSPNWAGMTPRFQEEARSCVLSQNARSSGREK